MENKGLPTEIAEWTWTNIVRNRQRTLAWKSLDDFQRQTWVDIVGEPFRDFILAKIREVVGGAGLTDGEIRNCHPYWNAISNDAVKRIRVVLEAYHQAILKALGGIDDDFLDGRLLGLRKMRECL